MPVNERSQRAEWQLPPGVTPGTWDYFQSEDISGKYDNYFADHPLFTFDADLIDDILVREGELSGKLVADLGCGTGRALVPLMKHGLRGLAIDLSPTMLDIVRQKTVSLGLPIHSIQANLCELDFLRDDSVDFAISLFSTLGMIQGETNRKEALKHTFRILKSQGLFVVHVHNFWFNLFDPGGPWWLLKNLWESRSKKGIERGDKYYSYRGVAKMFLHVFSRREIVKALQGAGFLVEKVVPLDTRLGKELRSGSFLGYIRASGWILVCRKP